MVKKPAKKAVKKPEAKPVASEPHKGCVDCGYLHKKFGHNECPLCQRCRSCSYTLRKCRCIESE